jgi:hypothetical protein|tara:strand:- start:157 stop:444 length:288 start_codon:yes stop_codon:yes gene_type:complete
MSRPKPKILMEFTNGRTYKTEQVLEAESIWAVFFQGAPFNLKSLNSLTNYPGPKYKKTSFSNPGHAFNLSKKLNSMFKTDEFSVYKLTDGEEISE